MSLVGLISCVKEKGANATEAKNLYNSPLFLKSKWYAEKRLDKYYILSAKYNLIDPNQIIKPYEETLKNKSKSERLLWAKDAFKKLQNLIKKDDKIVFLAGDLYREFLENLLEEHEIPHQTPLKKYSIGKQLQWYKNFTLYHNRLKDIDRLYDLIEKLKNGLGMFPKLNSFDGSKILPKRGLYIFFEDNEYRMTIPFVKRITRIGTHAVSAGSSSTLWSRLRTHRGGQDLTGNHRGSIFRLHIGNSIISKNNIHLDSWGIGQNAPSDIKEKEKNIEKMVSEYIGNMNFLWLNIPDEPTKFSDRSYLEKNMIALLSTYDYGLDRASTIWLGNYNKNCFINKSSLWNVNYVDLKYDARFFDILEYYVDATIGINAIPTNSIVPKEWHNLHHNNQQLGNC